MTRRCVSLLALGLSVFLAGCAPAPRFGRQEPQIAVGLGVATTEVLFGIDRRATVRVDARAIRSVGAGEYLVRAAGGSRFASADRAAAGEPPAVVPVLSLAPARGPRSGFPAPLLAVPDAGIVLTDRAGRKIVSARSQLEIRDARVRILRIDGRRRRQSGPFPPRIEFRLNSGRLLVINRLPVEEYLKGVLAAEMGGAAPLEALKAQAVVARNTALRRIGKGHGAYDVCATVHCQAYRGLAGVSSRIEEAVRTTRGQVLSYRGEICEAPYSAVCGGHTERADALWGGRLRPYLRGIVDAARRLRLDLTREGNVRRWVLSRPDVFCNDAAEDGGAEPVRSGFRWRRVLSERSLRKRLRGAVGKDPGPIRELRAVTRGVSGRIVSLRITGRAGSVLLKGELEIREGLASPALLSSCFVVDRRQESGKVVFVLNGAGYGHGVGLCQRGAVGMARRGYAYAQILSHYYPGTRLTHVY